MAMNVNRIDTSKRVTSGSGGAIPTMGVVGLVISGATLLVFSIACIVRISRRRKMRKMSRIAPAHLGGRPVHMAGASHSRSFANIRRPPVQSRESRTSIPKTQASVMLPQITADPIHDVAPIDDDPFVIDVPIAFPVLPRPLAVEHSDVSPKAPRLSRIAARTQSYIAARRSKAPPVETSRTVATSGDGGGSEDPEYSDEFSLSGDPIDYDDLVRAECIFGSENGHPAIPTAIPTEDISEGSGRI